MKFKLLPVKLILNKDFRVAKRAKYRQVITLTLLAFGVSHYLLKLSTNIKNYS